MVQQHRDWLVPNHYEEASNSLKLSVHSWLITVGGFLVFVLIVWLLWRRFQDLLRRA